MSLAMQARIAELETKVMELTAVIMELKEKADAEPEKHVLGRGRKKQ